MLTPSEGAHLDALLAAGPDYPEPEMQDCEDCEGSGIVVVCATYHDIQGGFHHIEDIHAKCPVCKGEGKIEKPDCD